MYMNEHWIELEFGDVVKYIQPTPYIVSSTEYNDRYHIPVLTPGKTFILGYTNEEQGVFRDVPVIIFDDFTTATKYVNFPFKVKSSALKILTPSTDQVDLKFAFYAMQITDVRTDTHKRYWISTFSKAKLRLPPLPEQHRITSKLEELFSELDNGIANIKKARAQLKVYRQAVLKAAFEGKLTQQWREQQRAAGNLPPAEALLAQIQEERQRHSKKPKEYPPLTEEEMKELPGLPKGWMWVRLGGLSEIVGGVTKGRNLEGQPTIELPYLRVANVQDGYLDLGIIKTIQVLPIDLSKYRLLAGDILYTEGGDKDKLGRGSVWKGEIPDCIHQNHIFRARLYHKGMAPSFVAYYSQTKSAKDYFFRNAKQTVNLASINLTVLSNLPVAVCSVAEQEKILEEIESRLSVCDHLEQEIDKALQQSEALRQSILKKAFEGRLVPQDPGDEPAGELLRRIKKS